MSLINEALRKARHEAARQDAARRGLSYPVAEQKSARPPLVPILAAVVLVVIAGGLVYWLGGRSARSGVDIAATPATAGEPESASGTVSSPAPPSPALAASEAAPEPAPPTSTPLGRESVARRESVAPAPEPRAAEPAPAARPIEPRPEPSESPRLTDPAPTVPAPRPASPPAAPAAEPTAAQPEPAATTVEPAPLPEEPAPTEGITGTFVGEASIPEAGQLRLGGIAWSERQPFALINGRVVGPGDWIQGLQIESVGRSEVVLRGNAGSYVLRLR